MVVWDEEGAFGLLDLQRRDLQQFELQVEGGLLKCHEIKIIEIIA